MSRRHVVRQRMRRPRKKMSLIAALGHACGISYKSGEHLAKHPEFAWMKDMPARGWTRFTAK